MIIEPEITHHAPAQMISYYKKYFHNVMSVNCEQCKNTIAIEVSEPISNDVLGLTFNQAGVCILPLPEKLLASRVRLDGMTGYQCICGNDMRANEIEEELSPSGEFQPHEVAAIQERMSTLGYMPPITNKNGREHRGTFSVGRL